MADVIEFPPAKDAYGTIYRTSIHPPDNKSEKSEYIVYAAIAALAVLGGISLRMCVAQEQEIRSRRLEATVIQEMYALDVGNNSSRYSLQIETTEGRVIGLTIADYVRGWCNGNTSKDGLGVLIEPGAKIVVHAYEFPPKNPQQIAACPENVEVLAATR